GIHVHPEILSFVLSEKGVDSVSLISDSIAPTGLGDGDYRLWGEKIEIRDNRTRNERGSIAGSVITMLDAVRNYRKLGASDQTIAKLASANPARLISVDDSRGSIDIGKRADLVAIDADGQVSMVLVGGKRADGHREN
ncbi:MAG TPA: amidohydrolase family protein, partial [Pyrinomonadaceae bacterium]|nr:amidohydrolase family protein [Pyrinomonadaceae bacterium]